MPLDHYVTLGRSGLRVSPFCLGTMTFGEDLGWGSSVKDSEAIWTTTSELWWQLHRHGELYTKGHSEKIIGDHLGHDRQRRDRLVDRHKFSGNMDVGDPNGGGSNRKSIFAACEQSLRRLRTDYIDVYWLHNWDKLTPIEETMAALHDLVQSGKVRYIAASDTPAWKVAQATPSRTFAAGPRSSVSRSSTPLLERTVEGEYDPGAEELGWASRPGPR